MSVESTIEGSPSVRPLDRFVARLERSGMARPGRTIVTRAPLRLDVMGGVADASGALTLSWTHGDGVIVAAQARDDQNISILSLPVETDRPRAPVTWSLAALSARDGSAGRDWPDDAAGSRCATLAERSVAALVTVLLERGGEANFGRGMSLFLGCALDDADLEASVSIQAAALLAISRLFDLALEPADSVAICRRAQRLVPGIPLGPAAPWTVLAGGAGHLLQVRGPLQPSTAGMRLAPGVTMVGIRSGSRHARAVEKCCDAHVAAAMGRRIVQVITSGTAGGATWDGQLCNISVPEYVAKLRDRLPTRIKGRAFVEKLGHLPECATPIVGEAVYKVRSRTEHHIYENARAHQFVERLSRWSRTGERDALLGAGELMYASHWSCGQRCGLGDIATDRLVNALRHRGAGEGIFGARISGCGAGGTVAVLMADAPAARRTVAEVLAEYEAGTGLRTRLLAGSSDGALTYGVHEA